MIKKNISIIVCGDICPTNDTVKLFENGNNTQLFNDVQFEFDNCDFLIGNLEFPLTKLGKGIPKCGPVLSGKVECLSVLVNAGFSALSLSNNHIKDCGVEGVATTLDLCKANGIQTVGAGLNDTLAKEPLVIIKGGWKIGILSFSELEFNASRKNEAGANIYDIYDSLDQIKKIKNNCDYVIILNHGGIEHYQYPSPQLQKKCRKMIEYGADLVLCQHSHCIGTVENYLTGEILYGQGNFVYGQRGNDSWDQGLLAKINLNAQTNMSEVNYIPIHAVTSGIKKLAYDKATVLIDEFKTRSKNIKNEDFILKSWKIFCESKKSLYYPFILGWGVQLNRLNRLFKNYIVALFFSKNRKRVTMNMLRCESHREVIQTILESDLEN